MTARIPNRGPITNAVRRRLEPLAALYGVSLEHLVAVVRARRRFRRARLERSYRRTGRWMGLAENAFRRPDRLRAGEGLLHGWLRALNLSESEFCRLVDMHPSTFRRWGGHSLWNWPIRFLELYAWARNMERFLAARGFDTESFRGRPADEFLSGRVPLPKIVLEGLTPEEKERIRKNQAQARGHARWKDRKKPEPEPDYSPWKL